MRRTICLLPVACFAAGPSLAQQPVSGVVEATSVAAPLPEGIAYDAAGNLYIALRNDHSVRKVDALGLITTIAGTGVQGFSGDGGAATSAMLDSPSGVAVDSSGRLYIADSRNHRVRMVAAGVITTVAGTGTAGFAGDGALATLAQINLPLALSLDAVGNLYVADANNHRIRKVVGGMISTVAGTGDQGFGGDGGAAISAQLDTPTGVAADPSSTGAFLIADTRNQRIRRVDVSGNISTVAGLGAASPQAAVALLNPRGVSTDAAGNVYFADSGNQQVRLLNSSAVTTVSGTAEQGFAGDLGSARTAVLDTPRATAPGPGGLLAFADTHNQRVRTIAAGLVSTVAGAPPPLTEGLLLSGPASVTFGSRNGSLTAVFRSPVAAASGSLALTSNGIPIATAAITGNTATFDLSSLSGGVQTLAISFPGDSSNAAVVSGVYVINVFGAAQSISFPPVQSPVTYQPGATVQLAATATSGLPITYGVTGPATVSGSTLTYSGPGTVVITATQMGSVNYTAASATQTVLVSASPLVLSGINPNSIQLTAASTPLRISGSGFTSTSVVQTNGAALPSTFVSSTLITATLPPVLSTAPQSITVSDPASQLQSVALPIAITTPTVSAALSAPSTVASRQQPGVNLQLQTAYPVPLQGLLTLSFAPTGGGSVDDPMIVFSNGQRTYPFTVPANTTTVPPIAFQTGTVSGTVTVSLKLSLASGADVTPATGNVVAVALPAEAPTGTGVSFVQDGAKLTVTLVGFSNTRAVSQATFNFTPAPGTSLAQTSLTLPVSSIFNDWFTSGASSALGSIFTYTQIFNLSDADSKVQAVSVTLTNAVGNSVAVTTP
ncbi:MAG: hypothetical protein ACRYF4_01890 [Janthinobacterium lividum]